MAAQTLHTLLVISDNTIRHMAKQDRFLKEFPFLKSLANAEAPGRRPGCSRCRKGNIRVSEIFGAAKRTLAALPPAKKGVLKKLLGAKQVRVVYKQGKQTKSLTF